MNAVPEAHEYKILHDSFAKTRLRDFRLATSYNGNLSLIARERPVKSGREMLKTSVTDGSPAAGSRAQRALRGTAKMISFDLRKMHRTIIHGQKSILCTS
ncbi:hypothetical protein EVAR_54912_1 [Eumeta japonica]|uniref:Uncharacterized protein n=1 Tax=Eumeta variegata TaxID=151549 RepID=A0A4C1Z2P6_EUMVA|nr:hypothetical protein EVAR_54912_1 [Eumeta japonica]